MGLWDRGDCHMGLDRIVASGSEACGLLGEEAMMADPGVSVPTAWTVGDGNLIEGVAWVLEAAVWLIDHDGVSSRDVDRLLLAIGRHAERHK